MRLGRLIQIKAHEYAISSQMIQRVARFTTDDANVDLV
jgi:hypothetical protein